MKALWWIVLSPNVWRANCFLQANKYMDTLMIANTHRWRQQTFVAAIINSVFPRNIKDLCACACWCACVCVMFCRTRITGQSCSHVTTVTHVQTEEKHQDKLQSLQIKSLQCFQQEQTCICLTCQMSVDVSSNNFVMVHGHCSGSV